MTKKTKIEYKKANQRRKAAILEAINTSSPQVKGPFIGAIGGMIQNGRHTRL